MIDLDELKRLAGRPVISAIDLGAYVAVHSDTIIAALEAAALVRDEDWLAERISDSLDVDWRPIDAARAIVRGLKLVEVGDAD